MKEITIVTAFFDINRANMKGFNRSNQKYLDYFKFWARIKNRLVVFADKETIKKVLEIREEFGLLDKTETVEIDDYTEIDSELYNRINNVMSTNYYRDFRLHRNVPEAVSPKYNYVVSLESWACSEAVKRNLTTGMVAWLDFGFNHGGEVYAKPEEFDFTWEHDFSDKIHYIQLCELDDCPPFEILRRNDTYIQGSMIIAPDYMWEGLWQSMRRNMMALTTAGLTDDDQLLLLMSYREKPEDFELHMCKWHEGFKILSDQNFTYTIHKRHILRDFLYKCKHPTEVMFIRKLVYSVRTFNILIKSKFKG